MKVKVQVVTITNDGQETTREIACVERQDLTPETFGLSLAEGKAVLQALQEVVVEWQMHVYLQQQRSCPHCGQARRSKGVHHTVFRTVFGMLPVDSPRLYRCGCQPHATTTFSPPGDLAPGTHNAGPALPGNQVVCSHVLWPDGQALAGCPLYR
jgi:hypothetical protein